MADKPTKKVSITLRRQRVGIPRCLIANFFAIRSDKSRDFVEVIIEPEGQRNERVTLDPTMLRSNMAMLTSYAARLQVEADDHTQKEAIPLPEQSTYANIIQFSQHGKRAETIFGVYAMADWVEAMREGQSRTSEIKSIDSVVVISTTALQKKFVLELLLAIKPEDS